MRLKIILLCAKKVKGVGELAIPGKDGKFADEEMIQG